MYLKEVIEWFLKEDYSDLIKEKTRKLILKKYNHGRLQRRKTKKLNQSEGWDCVLKNEMSIDTMKENQINEFQNELFEYAKNNTKNN